MTDQSERLAVFEYRLESQERMCAKIETSIASIAQTLNKLAILEQMHSQSRESIERAFAEIKTNQNRIRGIESELPQMVLAKRVVFGGVALFLTNTAGLAWLLITQG